MATYKGIQGFSIQNLSADPSNPIEGQVGIILLLMFGR